MNFRYGNEEVSLESLKISAKMQRIATFNIRKTTTYQDFVILKLIAIDMPTENIEILIEFLSAIKAPEPKFLDPGLRYYRHIAWQTRFWKFMYEADGKYFQTLIKAIKTLEIPKGKPFNACKFVNRIYYRLLKIKRDIWDQIGSTIRIVLELIKNQIDGRTLLTHKRLIASKLSKLERLIESNEVFDEKEEAYALIEKVRSRVNDWVTENETN
jgi:hypothetical protein